ncbi:MAG TPA: ribonuclease H-like domain-containing protein [Phnomibacter sp.]|nr:ribonuclease H-like domain-containing protein [Phnomibacter sp.]
MQLPNPEQIIVLDIETVSAYPSYSQMPEVWQQLWADKIGWQLPEEDTPESFYPKRAAILAEFGKIVCISAGFFNPGPQGLEFRVKSFTAKEEVTLLQQFQQAMEQLMQARKVRMWLAGHNVKEFDVPYLCRRLLVNQLSLPNWLNFQAQKPWEVPLIDTLQLWKFGDYKHYTSLNLLAACLGIASPKTNMDGSQVGPVYWQEGNLQRIASYCQQDVVTVAQLLLRFAGRPLLQPHQIVEATP